MVVDVMLKPEILDPQGQAILAALPKLGFAGVTSVRQGKRFELELSDDDVNAQHRAREIAATLLANPVIEDFAIRDGD
jgi:phosphoribosylformylglycinamidine synthase PurS subunit